VNINYFNLIIASIIIIISLYHKVSIKLLLGYIIATPLIGPIIPVFIVMYKKHDKVPYILVAVISISIGALFLGVGNKISLPDKIITDVSYIKGDSLTIGSRTYTDEFNVYSDTIQVSCDSSTHKVISYSPNRSISTIVNSIGTSFLYMHMILNDTDYFKYATFDSVAPKSVLGYMTENDNIIESIDWLLSYPNISSSLHDINYNFYSITLSINALLPNSHIEKIIDPNRVTCKPINKRKIHRRIKYGRSGQVLTIRKASNKFESNYSINKKLFYIQNRKDNLSDYYLDNLILKRKARWTQTRTINRNGNHITESRECGESWPYLTSKGEVWANRPWDCTSNSYNVSSNWSW
jgi:hypothetical protein